MHALTIRRLALVSFLLPTLAAATPSEGSCTAARADLGFWGSLGAALRRALTADPEGTALLTLEMPNGLPAILYGEQPDPAEPTFTNLVLHAADGRTYRLDPYGVGAISRALCAKYKSTHPYTYASADTKDLLEDVVAAGGDPDALRATRVESSIRVRAIHCMTEPY